MKLTIVVCDDEPAQVNIITSYIEKLDINYKLEILGVLSGEELLDKIEERKIDIAFLDIEMAGIDGINLGRRIREKYRDCIIIFITGFKDHALKAFDIDAFNYILKPIIEKIKPEKTVGTVPMVLLTKLMNIKGVLYEKNYFFNYNYYTFYMYYFNKL